MVGSWPHRAFTFRALAKIYGPMWLRCDVCRRYATLKLAGLHDVDYRSKTFSCSRCGAEAYLCLVEPIKETGMGDYRLDEQSEPQRHRAAVKRLSKPPPRIGQAKRWHIAASNRARALPGDGRARPGMSNGGAAFATAPHRIGAPPPWSNRRTRNSGSSKSSRAVRSPGWSSNKRWPSPRLT
jgi:hypothetical protein